MRKIDTLKLEGIFSKGYGFIAKIPMQDREISIGAKGLYSYLCSFSGKGEDSFPSRKEICRDLVISNYILNNYIQELKSKGLISTI